MEGDAMNTGLLGGPGAGGPQGVPQGDLAAPVSTPAMVRERHRVFVKSGVTVEVTEDVLQRHFSNYGSVTDVYIPRVMPQQTPKGFAYVSFDCEEAVHRALELESHEIDGKHFPVGRAEPRPSERGLWQRDQENYRQRPYDQPYVPWSGPGPRPMGPAMHGPPPPGVPPGPSGPVEAPVEHAPYIPEAPHFHAEVDPYGWMPGPGPGPGQGPGPGPIRGGPGSAAMKRNACRIFVGGVPDVLSEEDLKLHFEKYGKVEDVYFPKEKETRKRRGFCYVRFDNPKAADAAAARSPRTICGNEIGEIKIAQPRPGEGVPVDYHPDRDGYGPGGYGPHRGGPPYNPRSYEGRPPARFRPY